jgi:hypothetical protein
MLSWSEFAAPAPELAALGKERFDQTGLILLGSIRKNGWPRISPVEPIISEGRLYLGMMWQSRKALDLLRDPRCVVHNRYRTRMELRATSSSTGGLSSRRAGALLPGVI